MNLKRGWVGLLALLLLAMGMAQADGWVDAYAYGVVEEVNMERAKRGLGSLTVDAELMEAARIRAGEIVEKFSHTRPDGSSGRTVSSAVYGENIARGQKTVDKVMAAWMSSDGHRRNILREGFSTIGVCCYRSGNIYYWVQLFGK